MKMVHLSSGFRSTSQTSRADRSKNRHLCSGNKTKPRKVRGRHKVGSMVLRRWTFFVCDFAIQILYVILPYKICMWIPHTNSGCVRQIFLLCPLAVQYCKIYILWNLWPASFLRRLLVQWSGHVISHLRAHDRIPPTAFIMISWICTDF